ncbi:MAG: tRNA guanosine(15) transglycosylase TgtA [Candidatus Thermoplasmatota archaeon]|nr:tRNA guanosine(15) transglycosylase TgtA [Candidatus Thermoplasmatota archaeon]
MSFEIKQRDGLARLGVMQTAHGLVETPTLLPVINPNQMDITPSEIQKLFGAQMFITNSYIIKKSDSLRQKAMEEGLHNLIGFQGPIMTDSGTFQSHIYGDVDVMPQEIVAFQRDIGSDIGTILDIFTEPYHEKEQVAEAVAETVSRAKDAANYAGDMGLALPVQGGVYSDLREKCAKELAKLPAMIHPIGGVVPLMEDYRYGELAEIIIHSKKGLRHDRPVHLFGCGHPMLFPLAVFLGCDIFDSASYIKYAKDGRMMFPWGTWHLEEMDELPCGCAVCRSNTAQDIIGMEARERTRLLALHNLSVTFTELKHVRQTLRRGRLWEMMCERARAHPKLIEALSVLRKHSPWIEKYSPSSRPRGMLYTGVETLWRPEAYTTLNRLFTPSLYHRDSYIMVPFLEGASLEWVHEHRQELVSISSERGILVDTIFGPTPLELTESYPFGGMIVPTFPKEWVKTFYPTLEERRERMASRLQEMGKEVMGWDETIETEAAEKEMMEQYDKVRMKMICDYQFFAGAGELILGIDEEGGMGHVELVRSKNTGKVRNIISRGEHVLSLRAEDGLFTLKLAGARKLAEKKRGKHVVVDSESGQFNKKGKNVMAKFVIRAGEDINPQDEVYVLDDMDMLLAVGRALLTSDEMNDFKRGVALRVKEGVGAPDQE